jgi:phage portal protein BeeE
MIIKHPVGADRQKVLDYAKRLDAENGGVDNAYRTLNLYPGADATVVGSSMEQIDFREVQGAGETRIAAAAGVPPVIVGLSEGLQAATYSNYAQARRRFADGTMHPLWQNAAGSLAAILPRLGGDVRLWYDATDIPFLREDERDAADIKQVRAATLSSYISAGYTPDSSVKALMSGDERLLVHTGLYSVQLQEPGSAHTGGTTS